MAMPLRIPIGIDDFRELRQGGCTYVDKSSFIRELIDRSSTKVVLLPRPRRFGKSLNLSMLRYYFEKSSEDRAALFADLAIARAGEYYHREFNRYPVIHLTFKDVRFDSFDETWRGLQGKIARLYEEHRDLVERGRLSEMDRVRWREVVEERASMAGVANALLDLCRHLHKVHGEPVLVLLDEYDAPIHAAWLHCYTKEILNFFRAFFDATFKGNPHLHRGVLTGILRVARESIFSGLNNLGVYSVLAEPFNTCFGFTEPEVAALLEQAGLSQVLDKVRGYYNGYLFGGVPIYNPWSILSFLDSPTPQLKPYWVSTSSNDLVRELLQHHAQIIGPELETILAGGVVEKNLDENVVLSALRDEPDALYGLLVFTGYLKADGGTPVIGEPPPPYRLSIPNQEVADVYRSSFKSWLEQGLRSQGGAIQRLLKALLAGDATVLELELGALARHMLSYHDVGGPDPERFHHGLMLGLLASLEPDYEVRSNREAGSGRPDVIILPRQRLRARGNATAVVLELKAARRGQRTLAQALKEGVRQVRDRDYASALHEEGLTTVHALVIAFDGKQVRVVAADAAPKRKRTGV